MRGVGRDDGTGVVELEVEGHEFAVPCACEAGVAAGRDDTSDNITCVTGVAAGRDDTTTSKQSIADE